MFTYDNSGYDSPRVTTQELSSEDTLGKKAFVVTLHEDFIEDLKRDGVTKVSLYLYED